jgi:hypothetical protein
MSDDPPSQDAIVIQWGRFKAAIQGRLAILSVSAVIISIAAAWITGRLFGLL